LAVEHIYPLVYEFRKPKPKSAENNNSQNMCSINHIDDEIDDADALMYDKLIVDSSRHDQSTFSSSDSESDWCTRVRDALSILSSVPNLLSVFTIIQNTTFPEFCDKNNMSFIKPVRLLISKVTHLINTIRLL